jgi:HD-like signal output (HDOD) protein/prolyl-tRNA editing enzyme YbaK/EbsC (Cys-tRNA(Pro) deacylase)
MSIPAKIEQFLEAQNVSYQLAPVEETVPSPREQQLKEAGAAKLVMLQDDQGRLQAIIPGNHLLDLQKLNRLTKRNFEAARADAANQFCQQLAVSALPALPQLTGLPTIVDKALLEKTDIVVESGSSGTLLTLSQESFQQLMKESNAQAATFSVPLSGLQPAAASTETDNEQITSAVHNFTELRVKQRLDEVLEFPPLPDTAKRIIELRVDPYADINDLASIVEMDPSLAAQVVSWAASPYYAAPGKIKSVHDAIVRVLGFDLVLNLALGLALGKALSLPKDGPRGYSPFWQQAVFGAATVEALVKAVPAEHRPNLGMAYLSGLLHNFGYLVLAEVFPPQFSLFCRHAEANPHAAHWEIEQFLLGITRDQLAGLLMTNWRLPEEVCVALRFQNCPAYSGPHDTLAKMLNISSHLLRQKGIGDGSLDTPSPTLFRDLHLDPDRAKDIIGKVLASSDELVAIASDLAA